MTYDFHGSLWENVTGFNAPLYSADPGDIYTADQSVRYWINQFGSDKKHKINLGIPFYGYVWDVASGVSTRNSTGYKPSNNDWGQLSYSDVCQKVKTTGWTRVFDNTAKVPYVYGGSPRQWISYDDPESISGKIGYLNNMGLGGVKIWNIAEDDLSEF